MRKATQDGTGDTVGTITITVSSAGAIFKLDLHGLPPGHTVSTCMKMTAAGRPAERRPDSRPVPPADTSILTQPASTPDRWVTAISAICRVIEAGAGGIAKRR